MNELSPPVGSWSWSIHCTLCKLTMHKSYFFFPNTTLHWTHWDYHCGYQMYCIVKAIKNWVNGNNSRNTRHVPIYIYGTYSTFIDKHWYWFNWLNHCILCVFFFQKSMVLGPFFGPVWVHVNYSARQYWPLFTVEKMSILLKPLLQHAPVLGSPSVCTMFSKH